MCRSWLSPHTLHGHVRIEQRIPRFRSAPSRSWLSPHALHGHVRIGQRVPRFRSASSRSWLSPHMLHGFVRIEQRVPRFRSASSRSWLSPHMQKRGKVFWNASIPQTFPLFSLRCSMLNVKNRRPRSFYVCKNSDFKCAIRGSNPGHPD